MTKPLISAREASVLLSLSRARVHVADKSDGYPPLEDFTQGIGPYARQVANCIVLGDDAAACPHDREIKQLAEGYRQLAPIGI